MGAISARRAPALATAGLVGTVMAWLAAVALESRNGSATDNSGGWFSLALALVVLAIPAVGALVAAKRPSNPVGWLAIAAPMAFGLGLLAHGWAVHALRTGTGRGPGGELAAWFATWLIALAFGLVPFLLAVFPDGNVARWLHWPTRIAVVALVLATAAQAFAPDHLDGVDASVAPIANPLGIESLTSATGVVSGVCGGALVFFGFLALGTVVIRSIRGPEGDRRALRLFVGSLALVPAGFLVGGVVAAAGAHAADDIITGITQILAIVGSAFALGIGVLYDGVFDLRAYARRLTLGAVLSAVIVVGFVAVVSVIATVTSSSSAVPPAVAAAVVAIALGPLRGRLQRGAERLLYGWRSEPFRVLADLGDRLETTPDPATALTAVTESLVEGLRVPYARIDLDLGADGPVEVARAGHPVDALVSFGFSDGTRSLGRLVVAQRSPEEPFRPDELQLLRTLARQTSAAAQATLLTTELRAARARLVRSREEERQRLRRELHDGVGPALAGLSLQLDAAYDVAVRSPVDAAELLGSMQTSLRATAAEVRRIAHDLRPGVLDELGLSGAVREQAEFLAATSPGGLAVDLDLPEATDVPAAVEVAVFRIASEALTNVVRHAQAEHCAVRLCVNGQVELDIADDGVGFAAGSTTGGLGLRSMRDRAIELGGSFRISPRHPSGTLVEVRLPVRP